VPSFTYPRVGSQLDVGSGKGRSSQGEGGHSDGGGLECLLVEGHDLHGSASGRAGNGGPDRGLHHSGLHLRLIVGSDFTCFNVEGGDRRTESLSDSEARLEQQKKIPSVVHTLGRARCLACRIMLSTGMLRKQRVGAHGRTRHQRMGVVPGRSTSRRPRWERWERSG
jgi:hypothetical protein